MTRHTSHQLHGAVLLFMTGCAMGAPLDDGAPIDTTGATDTTGSTGETDAADTPDEPADTPPAEAARSFFTEYCVQCHGPESAAVANIDYIDDLDALVKNGLAVPGDPDASPILARLTDPDNPMPPKDVTPRPTPEEIAVVRDWIATGALPGEGACVNAFVSFDEMFAKMAQDLLSFEEVEDQRNIRYLTLTHLHNAGMCDRELDIYRQALTKGVNSLSLRPDLVVPEPIDSPQNTIFRIDLRDYGWDSNPNFTAADLWDTVAGLNPFAVPFRDGLADRVRQDTGTSVPFQPADSFLQIATGGPMFGVDPALELYYKILQLPNTLPALEALPFVGVPDREAAIDAGEAFRVILKTSGVATFNRAYDRYKGASFGSYYYRSSDFAGTDGPRNLFKFPTTFEADGGEQIFTLPNGLQGYAITDAADELVPEAPTAVVRDPGQRDSVVRAGASCMSCHASGIIDKRDVFWDFFQADDGGFGDELVRDDIDKLFSDPDGALARQRADAAQFKGLLAQLGINSPTPEPIYTLSRQFNSSLGLERVAAEMGFTPDDFVWTVGELDGAFGQLRNGELTRDELAEFFREGMCAILPGKKVIPDCDPTS